jgi:putative copper export protein/mono/diheme cytochrome c family protein
MDINVLLLATLRGVHMLALLVLIGTLVALLAVAPSPRINVTAAIRSARQGLLRMARITAVVTLLTGVAWLVMQAVTIGVATGLAQAVAVLWVVVRSTRFGQVVLIRLALVALAVPMLRARRDAQAIALLLVAVSLCLQGVLGHVGAVNVWLSTELIATEALHLGAVGAWLGGVPALFLLVTALPPPTARIAWRRFATIGVIAALLVTGTALILAAALVGDIPGLLGTTYGRLALLKSTLFLPLLIVAAIARFGMAQAPLPPDDAEARAHMLFLATVQAALGVGVVLVAGFLAAQLPAVQDQPVWPFPWRPSLIVMADPDLRHEVADALLAVAVAIAIAVVGLALRRARWLRVGRFPMGWLAPAIAAIVVWRAIPHLDLLLVEAYPTSYAVSPTGFTADSVALGATLFSANCAACHGATGRGDGALATTLPIRPADLTAPHLWEHSDGELFWWLSHGIDGPEGKLSMPGFAATLSAGERWALIDYVRAHNAGASMADQGGWPAALRAPSVSIACDPASGVDTNDLRGQVLRIVAGTEEDGVPTMPIPPQAGIRTITVGLSPDGTGLPVRGGCASVTRAAWVAYAAIAGVAPNKLAGTEFLVDPDGWLRAMWRPDTPGGWRTPDQLLAEIRRICTHPVAVPQGGHDAHHE